MVLRGGVTLMCGRAVCGSRRGYCMRRVTRCIAALLLILGSISLVRAQAYFPPNSFEAKAAKDKLVAEWYTHQLKALHEAPLFPAAAHRETYRFLWLRTFHHPISVRLDVHEDGTGILITKSASGAGGYAPGKLTEDRTRVLTRGEVSAFIAKAVAVHFWSLPSYDSDRGGCDGSEWVIEGAKNGKYHIVGRWSLDKGPVFNLGSALAFDLAYVQVPKDRLY